MTKVLDYGILKTRGKCRDIEYYFELDDAGDVRMFTDELIYGDHLEIVFSKQKQCFVIKNLSKLRETWNMKHSATKADEDQLVYFSEVKI